MSCLVPGRARAKFNLSRSRSGRSRSIGERLFLVLVVPRSRSFLKFKTVVPCSRSFLSSKLSFLVPGRSGSNLSGRSGSFRFVLGRSGSFWFELTGSGTSLCDGLNSDQSKISKMEQLI